jgi:predicted RNase H-like nuclease (RuvC/YqgF family)
MDFKKAKEVSLANPGSVITRNELGDFIVRRPDGSLVEPEKSENLEHVNRVLHEQLTFANQQREQLYNQLEKASEERQELQMQVDALKDKCSKLQCQIEDVPSEVWEDIAQKKRKAENERLINLAQDGELSSHQIQQLIDQSSRLGFTEGEKNVLNQKLYEVRKSEASEINPDSFVIHAKTDGQ